MASPVVLDSGPLVAILNRNDEFHPWAVSQLSDIDGKIITCEAVAAETYFLIRHVPGAVAQFLSLLERGVVSLEFDLRGNLSAVATLMRKYQDIPMSLADACLVRMSERQESSRIFTLDSDFTFYRRHGRHPIPLITPAP
jgi:predicted nucleic acid-binding protein